MAGVQNHQDQPLYVRDVTHPDGECPLHGTKGDCACTDTGLWGPKDYAEPIPAVAETPRDVPWGQHPQPCDCGDCP